MTTVINRPGVFNQERLMPVQPSTPPGSPPAAFLLANRRGPTTFTRCRSWSEFRKLFGGFNGDDMLPFAAFSFFNNDGQVAWFARVVGNGAATATLTFNSGATPALDISAHNPGLWGNSVYIDIEAGSVANTFTVVVHDGDSSAATVVERWSDVSLDPTSQRFVETVINTGSTVIRVARNGTGTNAPDTVAGSALAGGADGDAPGATEYEDAAHLLDNVPDPVVLALPGITSDTVLGPIIAYAREREDIFVVVDPPSGSDAQAAVDWAGALTPSTSYAAAYYPWLLSGDPSTNARGATRLLPPSPFVVGKILGTDLRRGVFKTPAGADTLLNGVVAPERVLTDDDLSLLNTNHVNALLRPPGGSGVVIYGGRTLRRTLEADRYVSNRRTLIYLKRSFKQLLSFAVFENNDEQLWSQIRSVLSDFLAGFWQARGLRGNNPAEAYFVKCDAENNPQSQVQEGYLYVDVGVALQYPAEFIVVRLGQFAGSTTATEL